SRSGVYRPGADRNLATAPNPSLRSRSVGEAEGEVWARTAAEGWRETQGAGDFMLMIGRIFAVTAGTHLYLAELDGRPIAAATLHIHEGVALRPRRAVGAARTAVAGRVRQRLRYRDDGRAAGKHFATKCRTSRVPNC